MNLIELQRSLRQLRLGGMAAVLEVRLRQAQAEATAPIDLVSRLVSDELGRRGDRLLERRRKQAGFRDANKTLDGFDFSFNPKMNHGLVFDLAACGFVGWDGEKPSGAGHRTGGHRAGPPCAVPRGAHAVGGTGRGCRRGQAQAAHGDGGGGGAADH